MNRSGAYTLAGLAVISEGEADLSSGHGGIAQAFFISREVFAVIWALALAGVGTWGAMPHRRGAVNMAATFAGIHFYTQWIERLQASPEAVMIAGVIAVAIAFALWRYNQGRHALV